MGIPRVVFYVLLIVMFETLAMTCFKKSLDDTKFFLGGMLFYTLVGYFLCLSFKEKGLAATNALWSALSVIATTSVGVLLFKEVLHLHDYIAIGLIAGGVVILRVTE